MRTTQPVRGSATRALTVAPVVFAVGDNEGMNLEALIELLAAIKRRDDSEVGTPTYAAMATALVVIAGASMYDDPPSWAYVLLEDALRSAEEFFNG